MKYLAKISEKAWSYISPLVMNPVGSFLFMGLLAVLVIGTSALTRFIDLKDPRWESVEWSVLFSIPSFWILITEVMGIWLVVLVLRSFSTSTQKNEK